MFLYLYEWVMSCASPCRFVAIPSWKALVLLELAMVVVMLVGHWTRRMLCMRFNEEDVKPFIDLVHHAEISFIVQAQLVFFVLSTTGIAWKLFLLTASLYYQIESPCMPAEANPIFGIVRTSLRHFNFNCQDDSSAPLDKKQHNVVTQRLVSWTMFFLALSFLYVKLYHKFFMHLLNGIIDTDDVEVRFCCALNNGFFWLVPVLEMLGILLFTKLSASACFGSSFIGESFVRVIFMIILSLFDMSVYLLLNPFTVLLTFAICDYHTYNVLRLAALVMATFVSAKIMEKSRNRKNKDSAGGHADGDVAPDEMGENNSAQNNSLHNNYSRNLVDIILSIVDEFPEDHLDDTYESCMINYSFNISIWLRKWMGRNFERLRTKMSEIQQNSNPEANDLHADDRYPDIKDSRVYFDDNVPLYGSESSSSWNEAITDFNDETVTGAPSYGRLSRVHVNDETKADYSVDNRSSRNDFKIGDNVEPISTNRSSTGHDNSEARDQSTRTNKLVKRSRYKRTFRNRSKLSNDQEFLNVKSKSRPRRPTEKKDKN